MNMFNIAKRIGPEYVNKYKCGYTLIQRVNEHLEFKDQLDPREAIGEDIVQVFEIAGPELYQKLIRIDVSDIEMEEFDISFFPKIPVVYFSLSLFILAVTLTAGYVRVAKNNGYLPTETKIMAIMQWVYELGLGKKED